MWLVWGPGRMLARQLGKPIGEDKVDGWAGPGDGPP